MLVIWKNAINKLVNYSWDHFYNEQLKNTIIGFDP